MDIVAIIPARLAATRFPNKPLALLSGLPMIEHVRRRVLLCKALTQVIVATCDEEIKNVVEDFGGDAVMTSDRHERCTEVDQRLGHVHGVARPSVWATGDQAIWMLEVGATRRPHRPCT